MPGVIGGKHGKAKDGGRFLGLWEKGLCKRATLSPALDKGRGFLCSKYISLSMRAIQGPKRTTKREDRHLAGIPDTQRPGRVKAGSLE